MARRRSWYEDGRRIFVFSNKSRSALLFFRTKNLNFRHPHYELPSFVPVIVVLTFPIVLLFPSSRCCLSIYTECCDKLNRGMLLTLLGEEEMGLGRDGYTRETTGYSQKMNSLLTFFHSHQVLVAPAIRHYYLRC